MLSQLLSIRDDLFDTFHKRHREGRELGDVQLTAESLHRLDVAFGVRLLIACLAFPGSIFKKLFSCLCSQCFSKRHID